VPGNERGLYMGVQHTFGGVSRVLFPIAAGVMMDGFGVGVPFLVSAVLVLATLPLTSAMEAYLQPREPAVEKAVEAIEEIAAADITGEMPTASGT
jgi:MFS family permease